jgi:hypothetical protein
MATFIDQRLMNKLHARNPPAQVEAIFVVQETGGADDDDGWLARRVIEAACQRAGHPPTAARYFPKANAVVVSATVSFIQEMLQDENVQVASAVDFDLIDYIFS